MRTRGPLALLVIAASLALSVSLATVITTAASDGDDNLSAPPEKAELHYPNLGYRLDQLVIRVESGDTSITGAAQDASVSQGGAVAVTIHLLGSVAEVVSFLEANGGDPRNVGEAYIEAYVPVTLLGQLSQQAGVIRVREIVPPLPAYGDFTSQGARVHGSPEWNQGGYSGDGIKVGVIDAGFEGFTDLMGTELPDTVHARCYLGIALHVPILEVCETVSSVLGFFTRFGDHGTKVAEAVTDVAPEVSLYIANPQTPGDLQDTVDWMVEENVQVINYSRNWLFGGPGDGTSGFDDGPLKTVDRAVHGGIVWANSAGNEGESTWFGTYSDPDGDGYISFDGDSNNDEGNGVELQEGHIIVVQLRWAGDWGGASRDLDLFIVPSDDINNVLARSVDPQTGDAGHVPFEWLVFRAPSDGNYDLRVSRFSGSVPDWIQLVVWDAGSIEHHTGHGSIGSPAESSNPGMLAVGASPWYNPRTIESYSSRGPTPDGRLKPDIVGATCGESSLMPLNARQRGFCGTSQASPHVAGMAALVRQRFPEYSPREVANYLRENAEQQEGPDPNNTWGHGLAELPPLVPPGPLPTVVFAGQSWNSAQIQAHIARHIAENGYGYPTEVTPGANLPLFQGLRSGEIQVMMEVWLPNLREEWEAALAAGEVVFSGLSLSSDWQSAFVVPAYLTELYPELDSVEDLKEQRYKDLFKTAETGDRARLVSCPVTWNQCDSVNREQIAGYGLEDHVHVINPATGPELDASLHEAYNLREPWLGYQWGTNEAALLLDLVRLEEPEYSDECWSTNRACAYEDATILIGGHSSLPDVAPEVSEFLGRWYFDVDTHLRETVRWQVANPDASTEEAALYWLSNNVDTWSNWVTHEAAARILANLPAGRNTDSCLQSLGTLTAAVTRNVSWTGDCASTHRAGRYARFYSFTLSQQTEVDINLTSSQDTFLYLLRGADANGTVVTDNDDVESGNTNSRITRTLAAGTYTIEATTYAEGVTGDFTLSIVPAGTTTTPPATDSCFQSLGALTDALTRNASWTGDCASTHRSDRYARFYPFTLNQQTEVEINLTSSQDTFLYLLRGADANGTVVTDNDDVESGNTNSRITLTLAAGTYTIEATTYGEGVTGDFTLSIVPAGATAPPPATDSCFQTLGSLTAAVTRDASWTGDCASTHRPGRHARFYSFTLRQQTEVQIDLTSSQDTFLYLLRGADANGAVVTDNDDVESGNTNSRITLTLTAGTYTIEATTYGQGVTGDFTLSIVPTGTTTPVPPPADACEYVLTAVSSAAPQGGSISGQWTGDCASTNQAGSYARYYTFTLPTASEVTITLESSVDTFLYLLEGAGTVGTVVARNDDIESGNTNSQITEFLAAGTYTIEATTYKEAVTGEFALTVTSVTVTPVPGSEDREALVVLYHATGGANWYSNDNWLSAAPVGQWYGVTTDSVGRVIGVSLSFNNLSGEIPVELASLSNLEVLLLRGNLLSGEIPTELSSLSNLEVLDLADNLLNGEIPTQLGNLTSLVSLHLARNQLTGCIPEGLADVASNDFASLGLPFCASGNVSADREALVALYHATGGAHWTNNHNWLSNAPLEQWYGVTTDSRGRVGELELVENGLSGRIPTVLGDLSSLRRLRLHQNQLSGNIPSELGRLSNLEVLSLWANELSGEIPLELVNLSNLEVLSLAGNQLTGQIPVQLANLSNLELLGLGSNQFYGELPPELGRLSNLEWLDLASNRLRGRIPTQLGNLSNLQRLWLGYNQWSGDLPTQLGNLTKLRGLSLPGNTFGGPIPFWMSRLTKLEWLYLSSNRFTGAIPSWLGSLTKLGGLTLSHNELSGEIPPELANLNLRYLRLAGNQLTGCIPEGLRNVERNDFDAVGLPFCGDGSPDLIAELGVSDGTLEPEASLTLYGRVENQGDGLSASTTLRYYRSTNATISTSDAEVAREPVVSLGPSGRWFPPAIPLTAPSNPGIYYYGACVDPVPGESNPDNNCSTGKMVTVIDPAPANQAPTVFRVSPSSAAVSLNAGDSQTFSARATDPDDNISQWEWYVNNQSRGGQSLSPTGSITRSFSHTFSGAGNYTVTVTFTDLDGESDSVSWSVAVSDPAPANQAPTVYRLSPSSPVSLTAGDSQTFSARATDPDDNISQWEWYVNNQSRGGQSLSLTGSITRDFSHTFSSAGNYTVTVTFTDADGESDSVSWSVAVCCAGQGSPDLYVYSPSVYDKVFEPGERFQMSFWVRNQGDGASTTTADLRYYRSTNSTISTSDTQLTIQSGTTGVGPIEASGSTLVTVHLNAHSSGTYYYGACVATVAGESNTQNNCTAVFRVTLASPDLVVESESVSDGSVEAGDTFTFRATVRNQGNSTAASTTLRYYRSTNSTISTSDTEVDTDSVRSLDQSETSAESERLTAPEIAGTYYYGACVDSVSGESNTGNNCSSGVRVTVTAAGQRAPDLVADSPSFSDTNPERGTSVRLTVIVRNQGNAQAGSTTLRIQRSIYSNFRFTIEIEDFDVASLGASRSRSYTILNHNVPNYVDTFYYRACVDSISDESDTQNNCSSATVVTTR